MDFGESVRYLYSLGNEVTAMKLGLANITRLLTALGEPQTKYLKVQVAGTNGKGSVCAFINSISRSAGIRTGLYTSPHLVSITERIKIDGNDISKAEFARLATRVRSVAEDLRRSGELEYTPTFFEQVTAVALLAFTDAEVKLAILETGLGGRLDATTAADAEIAVITRIDLDHQEYLGDAVGAIAAEKSAIIRSCTTAAVIGEQGPHAMSVLMVRCQELGLKPALAELVITTRDRDRLHFETDTTTYTVPRLGLMGRHQIENAKAAILAIEKLRQHLPIEVQDVVNGLAAAKHPGRLEYIGQFLLDGAHNINGARALRAFLDESEPRRRVVLIFAAMEGKNVRQMLAELAPRAGEIVFTRPANSRAIMPDELVEHLPTSIDRSSVHVKPSVNDAVAAGRKLAGPDDLILVCGSLYLVGEARALICEQVGNQ